MNDPNLQTAAQLLNSNLQHDHTIGGSTSATTSGGCSELEQMIAAASIGKRSETVVTNKRKKSKPKSHGQHAAAPPNSARPPELDHQAVQKHLDDWLDNCLKDAPLTSSSSEFLDTQFPAQPSHHASTSSLKRGSGATASAAANAAAAAAAAAQMMYGPAGGAKMFGGGAGPKPSETPTRAAMHDPFHNYQKYFPMYPPMGGDQPNFGSGITLNGAAPHGMSNSNYMNGSRQSNMNSDFSSLPPAVNLMNRGKDLRIDAQDILDGLDHRHFSDPCLAGASDDSKDSGNGPTTTTHRSPNSPKNESTKMLSTILEQIGALHDTNSKICRSLHENKVDIEALKHAPNWGLRHRRDSISGLSTHSQPLGYAAFGTHSPAPTFHSGMYTPGMLTDVVREVKEAARVREDALLNRVKALVEERSWMQSDSNAKLMREVEELKSQIGQLKSDRKETHSRFGKMEDELKSLRTLLTLVLHSQNVGAYHHPAVGSNMPQFHQHQPQQQLPMGGHQQQHQLQQQQRPHRSSLSLSYGTINNNHDDTDLQAYVAVAGGDEDATTVDGGPLLTNGTKYGGHKATDGGAPLMDDRIAQIVRDNMDLRSDLSSALESRKMAESKITSLENMVMKLQSSITHGEPHHLQQHHNNTNNTSLGGSSNVGQQQQQQQQQQMRSCSRNSSFSEGPAHTSSSSSTVVGVKTSGSGNLQHHHHSTPNASKSGHNNGGGGTTISVVGPVTDL